MMYQMIKWKKSSALLALCGENSPVTDEFPTQRSVTRSFDIFFDLRLNQQVCKERRHRGFETPSHPLWRHCSARANEPRQLNNEQYFQCGRYRSSQIFSWCLYATFYGEMPVLSTTIYDQVIYVLTACSRINSSLQDLVNKSQVIL